MPVAFWLLFVAALLIQQPAFLRAQAPAARHPGGGVSGLRGSSRARGSPSFWRRASDTPAVSPATVMVRPCACRSFSPGASTWNEEQSRRNFQVVAPRVVPLSPLQSKLLIHPLETEAGR